VEGEAMEVYYSDDEEEEMPQVLDGQREITDWSEE
jgi:hypothetical protein